MPDLDLPTEEEYRDMALRFGRIWPEENWLEAAGNLSAMSAKSAEGKLRSRLGMSAIIDELVQPYSQLTDCALDECGEPGHCRMCLACGEDLQPWQHKVIWSGPEGWPVCNRQCGERYAAAFFIPNKEAVLY